MKILKTEPEYNILKNKNFRNNQNYITNKKIFLEYEKALDKSEELVFFIYILDLFLLKILNESSIINKQLPL